MAFYTSPSLHRAGSLLARPSTKRGNVSLHAANQTIMFVSVEQHFGSKAIEEFEKSKLEQLDINDLTALSEQVKERVTTLKPPQLPELPGDLKLPELELPSDLQLPELSGLGDAVRKFGEGIDTPVELNAALEALKSSSAASLAASVPQNGGDFAPHWGSQAISGVLSVFTDSVYGLLHQIVVQITEKIASTGAY